MVQVGHEKTFIGHGSVKFKPEAWELVSLMLYLSVTAVYANPSRVNLAWMDLAPCLPKRPKQTCVEFAHGVA